MKPRHWTWWFTVLVVAFVAGIRIWSMNFPLERDEGEYAYAGQLILQGVPPYELAYNMKFPGTYAGYALMMGLFGETAAGIHFGILCLTTLTALMLYWLGKNILDGLFGMVAATFYAVLAAEPLMFGLAGHATHFIAFFVTAALCMMWKARTTGDWVRAGLSGVLFGMALLMKQHAAVIGLWAVSVYVVDAIRHRDAPSPRRWFNSAAAFVGLLLPFAICCVVLWQAGVFGKFWFWTVDYAREYVSVLPFSVAWDRLWWSLRAMTSENRLLWAVAGLGFFLVWRDPRLKPVAGWLTGLAVASLLSTAPGFYFRTHYFLLTLPALAFLAAAAIACVGRLLSVRFPARSGCIAAGFYLVCLGVSVARDWGMWSSFGRAQGADVLRAHEFYGLEPFPEAESVAQFIRANSDPSSRVAVLGSEPEIYFLSHRRSATGYVYMYPLMEAQAFAGRMQEDMVREVMTNAPEFIVVVQLDSSWLMTKQSDKTIFDWWSSYQTNYTYVGCVDMVSPAEISHELGRERVVRYGRTPTNGLIVYQRNH